MKQTYVAALIEAYASNDRDRGRSLALAIAASEAERSPDFAKRVRRAVERSVGLVELPQDLRDMFMTSSRSVTMEDLVLDEHTTRRLTSFLAEQSAYDLLFTNGLEPGRKALFVGPPGVGKTMAAHALARKLELPFLRVALHGVIDSYLGKTAQHLAKVFQYIRSARGVYLFDEIDALVPKRHGDVTDVAEMRRVVNSFLTMLEDDDSRSVIIAATNHVELLDKAVFRRFDEVIEFKLPTADIALELMFRTLKWRPGQAIVEATANLGHADIVAAVKQVRKRAVLAEMPIAGVADEVFVRALQDRKEHRNA